MIQIKFNSELVQNRLAEKGILLVDIAKSLDVEESDVLEWVKGGLPDNPAHLIEMLRCLDINLGDAFLRENNLHFDFKLPRTTQKINEYRRTAVQSMAENLEFINEYFEATDVRIQTPYRIEYQDFDYNIIQNLANEIRSFLKINNQAIDFISIIEFLTQKCNTKIIPVLWGDKNYFADGLQITFPKFSYVYINLNSCIDDLKFWMLHEMAHIINPNLKSYREEFANNLAGAILVPEDLAKDIYSTHIKDKDFNTLHDVCFDFASKLDIDKYTILKEVEKYVKNQGLKWRSLDKEQQTKFHRYNRFKTRIIDTNEPIPLIKYIDTAKLFGTDIFDIMSNLIKQNKFEPRNLMTMLQISYFDAKALYDTLKEDAL